MNIVITPQHPLQGTLTVPSDKAIGHRAAILCALGAGTTTIRPWSSAEDCQHTLEVLKRLGVSIAAQGDSVRITGAGLTGLRAPSADLPCGDSGTTMRLLAGVLAGQPFASRLTAGSSLSKRPMRRIAEPLSQMGAQIRGAQQGADLRPPLEIQGRRPLKAIRYTLPVASAQVKSAVLLAGLFADGPTAVVEPLPTRDHTERLLAHLGCDVRAADGTITVTPPAQSYQIPQELRLPADPSSAAFFIVAATVVPGSRLVLHEVGLNPTRSAFLDVLRRMGADIRIEGPSSSWEPRGTLTVCAHQLVATRIARTEVPALIDELPILMIAAAAAAGTSVFERLEELKVKESDRLTAMLLLLRQLGIAATPRGAADLQMTGGPMRGTVAESMGDHRIAMSAAVAGLIAQGRTTIRGAECVKKSFGSFFELLAAVAPTGTVQAAS